MCRAYPIIDKTNKGEIWCEMYICEIIVNYRYLPGRKGKEPYELGYNYLAQALTFSHWLVSP